jgi:hypothetical protein
VFRVRVDRAALLQHALGQVGQRQPELLCEVRREAPAAAAEFEHCRHTRCWQWADALQQIVNFLDVVHRW